MAKDYFAEATEKIAPKGNNVGVKISTEAGFPLLVGLRLKLHKHFGTTKQTPIAILDQLDWMNKQTGDIVIMIEVAND